MVIEHQHLKKIISKFLPILDQKWNKVIIFKVFTLVSLS